MAIVANPYLFDEERIKRACVRLRHQNGQSAGTGFFISRDVLLTCYHVVAPYIESRQSEIKVAIDDGRESLPAEIDLSRSAPSLDIAVVRTVGWKSEWVLSCGNGARPGQSIWSSGFQQIDSAIQGATPTTGRLGGGSRFRFPGPPCCDFPGFTLESLTVRPGLSGAPVVDLETGVVLGMADAEYLQFGQVELGGRMTAHGGKLSGYAIDLNEASEEHHEIGDLMRTNRAEIPAFGSYLNGAGARILCRRQMEAVTRELENVGKFDAAKCVTRQRLKASVEEFVHSGRGKFLAISGNTGVGKTMSLAELACQLSEASQATLLIRGLHTQVDQQNLKEVLHDSMKQIFGAAFSNIDGLLQAISPAPLVVLFDGLNEIPTDASKLQSWWEQTVTWLAGHDVRIVASCRFQLWDNLKNHIQRNLLFIPGSSTEERNPQATDQSEPLAYVLGDFSEDEYDDARARYQLDSGEFRSQLSRHPFFLRLWEELRTVKLKQEIGTNPTSYDLLENYADNMIRIVAESANKRGGRQYSRPQVRRALSKLGRLMLESETNALAVSDVDEALTNDRELQDTLIYEHVLEEGSDNYRFAFDAFGEFMMSLHITPFPLNESLCDSLLQYGTNSKSNAVGLALLRAEHEGKSEEQISDAFTTIKDYGPRSDFSFRCLALLLVDFRNPGRHFAVLKDAVRKFSQPWWRRTVEAIAKLAHCGRIPIKDVIDLFKSSFIAQGPDPYLFEWKNWHSKWTTEEFESEAEYGEKDSPAAALLKIVDVYPREAMSALVTWLSDTTPISDMSSPAIADVAAAVLYHRRKLAFDALCDELTKQRSYKSVDLLSAILEAEPEQAVGAIERWLGGNDRMLDDLVIYLSNSIVRSNPAGFDNGGLGRLLRSILDRRPNCPELLEAMSCLPSQCDYVFPLIRDALLNFAKDFRLELLSVYLATRWQEILPIVDAWLAIDSDSAHQSILKVLSSKQVFETNERLSNAVDRLERLLGRLGESSGWEMSYTIQTFLGKVSSDSHVRGRVLQLAKSSLDRLPISGRKGIINYATCRPALCNDPEDRMALLDVALHAEESRECQRKLIDRLCTWQPTFSRLLSILQPLRQRMDCSEFEFEVIGGLETASSHFESSYFTDWRAEAETPLMGELFQALFLESGRAETPYAAVQAVIHRND